MREIELTCARLEAMLLELQAEIGHPLEVEQVDIVRCEDNVSLMAYVYIGGTDMPLAACFDYPAPFDREAMERALMPRLVSSLLH